MSKKKVVILVLSIITFLVLTLVYITGDLSPVDNLFFNFITKIRSPFLTSIMKFITDVGGVYGIVCIIAVTTLINRKKGIYFMVNNGLISLANQVLKYFFMRPRPDMLFRLIKETGFSFPSGHTMNAVAAYGLLLYYVLHSNLSKKVKNILSKLIILLMILIPFSRVYLGVHYITDILAGASISLIWLVFYTEYLKKKDI